MQILSFEALHIGIYLEILIFIVHDQIYLVDNYEDEKSENILHPRIHVLVGEKLSCTIPKTLLFSNSTCAFRHSFDGILSPR